MLLPSQHFLVSEMEVQRKAKAEAKADASGCVNAAGGLKERFAIEKINRQIFMDYFLAKFQNLNIRYMHMKVLMS